MAFLSDRYSKFELDLLDHLRVHRRASVYGYVLVKSLLDEGLIANAHTISTFTYDADGSKEVQEFVAILTPKGEKFLADWNSGGDALTYDA